MFKSALLSRYRLNAHRQGKMFYLFEYLLIQHSCVPTWGFKKWPIIIGYVLKLISAFLVTVDLHIYEICFLLFWPNVTSPSKLVSPNVPWAMSECHQMTLFLFMVRKYRKYCNDILSVCSVFNDGKINL